jgi:hypothetical protein
VRTFLIGLLIIVCLVVILIPAFIATPEPVLARSRHERAAFPPFWFEGAPLWMRMGPFGVRAEGWQGILSAVASWVYLYLTSALMLMLFPRRVRIITEALKSSGWRTRLRLFAVGFLATLASTLMILLARFAFVWFVLVIILTGAVFVLAYLGVIGAGLAVGGAVRRWAKFPPSPWVELAFGSLVLFTLGRIPVVGWFGIGIVAALGLGAVLATHLGSGQPWSLRDWETETES